VIFHASVNRTYRKDTAALGGYEHRIAWLCNPLQDDFGSLVAHPSRQERRVVPVIGDAQLRYRSPQHLAGGRRVFRRGIQNLHRDMLPPRVTEDNAQMRACSA
jgi:hypothetical protein